MVLIRLINSHKMWAVKLSLVDSKEFFDSDMTNYFE